MAIDTATIRATVIAHAIRLGKCPIVGTIIDFNFSFQEIDQEDLDAGRLDKAVPRSVAHRVAFSVTADDIVAAKKLINDQKAVYTEPKLTKVEL